MKLYVKTNWDNSKFEFSADEGKIINSLKTKGIDDILPDEEKLINEKYASFFGRIDEEFGTPLYREISNVLIAPALMKGAHITEMNPFRTKSIALQYTMNAPDVISEEEYEKRFNTVDGTNFVLIRIYREK